MNQTAINLIAICVFLMTLSTLLGPLIHLSPTIPALTILGFLGIATLDNFRFEGRGGTIFLDWLARFSPTYKERIIYHEAGHFLVAHLSGITVTGYTLSAWEAWKIGQPGQGGIILGDDEIAKQLERGKIGVSMLEKYCNIWMAGIAAELLVFNSAEGGGDDKAKLNQFLTVLGFQETLFEQKQRFHLLQAKNLLEQNWQTYQHLVQAMRNRLDVEECKKLIA
ncbi:ATP-dependent Zn protease [Raphidiopsis sp. BLCC-F218]